MKIVYINTYGNGSTGKIVNQLKTLCFENGITAKSYFSREFCATPETSIRFFNKAGFYIDGLMTRLFDNHGLNSRLNTKRIIKQLKVDKPDIIHIHNLHGYWINYKMLFSYIKKSNIKVVFTLHDCWSFTGHCTHFDFIQCGKWKTQCHSCPQKNMYPKSSFYDRSKTNYIQKKKAFCSLNNNQMTIVTPSNWLKSKVDQSFLNKYKCIVINNGVDTSVFKPIESNLRERYKIYNSHLILSVASYWDERKGLGYVISCARNNKDCFFVYIGQDKNVLDDVPENVIHIDRTESQQELAEWYSTADVFLNTTLEDSYPTTNLEAVACGTPVLTFRTGGSPEIVDETGYGLIIDRDVDSINNGIRHILKSEKKQLNSETDFLDSKNRFSKYITLYKELMNE